MDTRGVRRGIVGSVLLVGLAVAPAAASVVDGTPGGDVLTGTSTADTIRGYAGADIIKGYAGADVLHGGAGDDDLYAGSGADTVYGGAGSDRIFPGNDLQTDILRGGPGADLIIARVGKTGVGRDIVDAGTGNDLVKVLEVGRWYMPVVDCGPGVDTVVMPKGVDFGTKGCERILHTNQYPPLE